MHHEQHTPTVGIRQAFPLNWKKWSSIIFNCFPRKFLLFRISTQQRFLRGIRPQDAVGRASPWLCRKREMGLSCHASTCRMSSSSAWTSRKPWWNLKFNVRRRFCNVRKLHVEFGAQANEVPITDESNIYQNATTYKIINFLRLELTNIQSAMYLTSSSKIRQ